MSRICVTIAVEDHLKLEKRIEEALRLADIVEIRFDYIAKEELEASLAIASRVKDKAIFTCRSEEEGGKMKDDERRIEILEQLIETRPWLVDIEYNTLLKHEELLRNDILVSWHNFLYTPSISILEKQMKDMSKLSKNIKIVTFANNIIDNKGILELYNRIDDDTRLVAFCMGELGMASRILSLVYGSPFTYAVIDTPIVAGQMRIDEVRDAMSKIRTDEVILNRVIHIIDEIVYNRS